MSDLTRRREPAHLTKELFQQMLDAPKPDPGPDVELMSQSEYEQRHRDLERFGRYWPYGLGRPSNLPR